MKNFVFLLFAFATNCSGLFAQAITPHNTDGRNTSDRDRIASTSAQSVTGIVVSIQPAKKTFVIRIEGQEYILSVSDLKNLPKVGDTLTLKNNPRVQLEKDCEICKRTCTFGVCIDSGNNNDCLCYFLDVSMPPSSNGRN